LQIKTKIVSCLPADSKPVKQEDKMSKNKSLQKIRKDRIDDTHTGITKCDWKAHIYVVQKEAYRGQH
jgi:hypothetical protein